MAYSLNKEILYAPIQKVWTTYRDHLPTLAEVMHHSRFDYGS